MKVVSLLIKPASGNCNLSCKYCFYKELLDKNHLHMKLNVLETIVKKAFIVAADAVVFAFQGGEPTLVGLPFYHKLIEYVSIYNQNKIAVSYSIQTNGILITQEWCEFFVQNNFLVGISLDGDQETHDLLRYDYQKNGTYNYVLKAIDLFNQNQVEYNILTVVNSYNYYKMNQIYEHFKQNHFSYLQFIPYCKPFIKENDPLQLSSESYFIFLDTLFNNWYRDILNGIPISIRYFDNIVLKLMNEHVSSCDLLGVCSSNLIIESNGDVYPCDFYVVDEYKLGNILVNSISELRNNDFAVKFVVESNNLSNKCLNCEVKSLCLGGCKRYSKNPINIKHKDHLYCSSIKKFLTKNLSKFKEIATFFMESTR